MEEDSRPEVTRLCSTGTLRYSPKLLGSTSSRWWLVIDCDESIGKYYRHLYWLYRHKTNTMLRPAWKEHITVVRDEEPPNKQFWDRYAGRSIGFEYSMESLTDGEYWWLTVHCPMLDEIRSELGLPAPAIPYHLSIGHLTEE